MKTSPVLSIFLIPVLCLFSACASLPVSDTPRAPLWAAPIYEDLLAAAKKAEGRPFDAVRETIEKRIDREPVFPAATEKIRSDELFLLSPRNTKVRPSSWNRAFIWNQAEGGRDYVLHVYSGDSEVLRRPMGSARRTMVTEHDAPFVPGAVYSWDISLCVERCTLHLSSRPALRPTYCLLFPSEEEAVAGDLSAVEGWCEKTGIAGSEKAAALVALTLEDAGLFLDEAQFLEKELKKHPDSVLLLLVYSEALSAMNSSYTARDQYEKARALFDKESGVTASDAAGGSPEGGK